MTEKEYRSLPAISRSELWVLRDSPEKLKYMQEHHEESSSPALIFGAVFHKMVLEPDDFESEYAVAPDVDRRTKAGKEAYAAFVESAEGKTVIDRAMYDKAVEMADKIKSMSVCRKLLNGEHEVPFFWTDALTGEPCKIRVDAISEYNGRNIIVDLKTTTDASTSGFMRHALNYGYDFQSAMYSEGVKVNTGKKPMFVFIAVEKEPPYAVNVLNASEEFMSRGERIFRELIGEYHYCRENDDFYGYMGREGLISDLDLPEWAKDGE